MKQSNLKLEHGSLLMLLYYGKTYKLYQILHLPRLIRMRKSIICSGKVMALEKAIKMDPSEKILLYCFLMAQNDPAI